jgi:hypothetical protein
MPFKDELDRYNIGSILRQRLYLGSLSMAISLVVAFVWLYVKCQNSKEEIWKLYIGDVRQGIRKDVQAEVKRADFELSPKIEEVNRVTDSLKHEIDSLQKLRTK